MRKNKVYAATASSVMLLGAVAYTGNGSAAATGDDADGARAVETRTSLTTLNNSGARGMAEVDVNHRRLDVDVDVRRVLAKSPHAMHIHFGAQARHECPTVADDRNGDFRLTTTDGLPAYGPIRVSFTTRGKTGAGSGLAVNRFPTAPKGKIHYDRHIKTSSKVARAIRRGDAVVVVHGVDYNDNGKYDFRSAGRSELDPKLPAEATDPAACGVLHRW
jgi:hypothetical protein